MFEHDTAVYHDSIYIGTGFRVDEGIQGMVQWLQEHRIAAYEYQIGFVTWCYSPEHVRHTEDAGTAPRGQFPGRLRPDPTSWLMGKAHFADQGSEAHGLE